MQEYFSEIKMTLAQMAVYGAVVTGFLYYSGPSELAVGFILGLLTSIVYYLLLSNRVKTSASLPTAKAISAMRIGWGVRLSFVTFMLVLAAKLPQVNLWAAVAGILSLHAVLILKAAAIIIKAVAHLGKDGTS